MRKLSQALIHFSIISIGTILTTSAQSMLYPSIGSAQLAVGANTSSSSAIVTHHDLSNQEYQNRFNQYLVQGYSLVDISGYVVNGVDRYAAVWSKSPTVKSMARHNLSSSEYQQTVNDLAKQGYYLKHISTYVVNGQARFAAIWHQDFNKQWVARHDLSSEQYQQESNWWSSQGYRPTVVAGYTVNGQTKFVSVWEKNVSTVSVASRHHLTPTQFEAENKYWRDRNYKLTHLSGYANNNQANYAAIWEQISVPSTGASIGLSSENYQSQLDNRRFAGEQLVKVTGFNVGNNPPQFAAIWRETGLEQVSQNHIKSVVNEFTKKYSVPGLAIAIAKDGRLVFAQGYGFADRDRGLQTSPNHLFRVASVSKPITAIAMMKLIEEGKVQLSMPVFGSSGVFGNKYPKGDAKITVQQLLEHSSGGWGNSMNDPMFLNPMMNHHELITWTTNNIPLQNTPGSKYDYSNFGYSLLGRVIEARTGSSYEKYVTDKILAPAGITRMQIAGNTLADRKAGEVVYYGQNNENPYTMNINRMDAHGGWIASPIDLLRLSVRADGFSSKPDILSQASINMMVQPSRTNPNYAKGWHVNAFNNSWHIGSMPGTTSMIARTQDGFTWAIVMNSRQSGVAMMQDLDAMFWRINGQVKQWPAYDLF